MFESVPGSVAEPPRYLLWGSAGHAKVLAALISLRGGRVYEGWVRLRWDL